MQKAGEKNQREDVRKSGRIIGNNWCQSGTLVTLFSAFLSGILKLTKEYINLKNIFDRRTRLWWDLHELQDFQLRKSRNMRNAFQDVSVKFMIISRCKDLFARAPSRSLTQLFKVFDDPFS